MRRATCHLLQASRMPSGPGATYTRTRYTAHRLPFLPPPRLPAMLLPAMTARCACHTCHIPYLHTPVTHIHTHALRTPLPACPHFALLHSVYTHTAHTTHTTHTPHITLPPLHLHTCRTLPSATMPLTCPPHPQLHLPHTHCDMLPVPPPMVLTSCLHHYHHTMRLCLVLAPTLSPTLLLPLH